MPKVSIILPTYNGEKLIGHSIDSVLAQSFTDFELIIVNDASTDSTKDIINTYCSNDQRVVCITNVKNLKLPGTLNNGVASAHGKYIARIDDDDVWVDTKKLEKQIEFLENNPSVVLIGTQFQSVDQNGKVLIEKSFSGDDTSIRKIILNSNPFGHSTVVFKKSAFEKSGGYNTSLSYTEDWDLWLKLGKIGKIHIINTVSVKYLTRNVFRNGMSNNIRKWAQIKYNLRIMLIYGFYYHFDIIGLTKKLVYYLLYV